MTQQERPCSPEQPTRRDVLCHAMIATAGACALSAKTMAAGGGRDAGAEGVSTYTFGNRVWVRVDSRVFTCYRAESTQKYPYFYPIVGPATGLPMTAETGMPWPHHRSMFLGCDHVNEGNYWQQPLSHGQIVSRGPLPRRKIAQVPEDGP